jgi:adenylate kinase
MNALSSVQSFRPALSPRLPATGERPSTTTELATPADQVEVGVAPAEEVRPSPAGAAASAIGAASAAVGGWVAPALRLVLTGPPGSGKGTQAAVLSQIFGAPHLSTGAILREEVKNGTELGKQAHPYMQAGQLVPDHLILAMVEQRINTLPSFILDGFPRSLSQAEKLDDMLQVPLTAVASLDCDDEVLVKRLLARGREDDTEEVIRERLKVYHEQTRPVLTHYEAQGLLQPIPGNGSVGEVARFLSQRMAEQLYRGA